DGFRIWIRALVGAFTQTSVIPPATEYLQHYDRRFEAVDDIKAHMAMLVDTSRNAISEHAQTLAKNLRDAASKVDSKIAAKIGRIPEQHLSLAFDAIQRAGLRAFCPDVVGPVQSTYNQIHRHLAVTTFQTAVRILGLHGLETDIRVVDNYGLLADVYENYVYGRLARTTTTERNNPGSLAASSASQVVVRRRKTRCVARYNMAKQLRYRRAVLCGLRVPEMHSDDEYAPGSKTELIHYPKPARSSKMTRMVRHLDKKIAELKAQNKKPGQKKPLTRTKIYKNPSSLSLVLPPNTPKNKIPLDCIDPKYYNTVLTVRERAAYMYNRIAMPIERYLFREDHSAWKLMATNQFNKLYASRVLQEYDLPTEEELAAAEGGNGGLDSDDSLADTEQDPEDEMEVEPEMESEPEAESGPQAGPSGTAKERMEQQG
ncbi:hypothetical protein C8F01DRAFT_1170971, partial [Mycena amicta]